MFVRFTESMGFIGLVGFIGFVGLIGFTWSVGFIGSGPEDLGLSAGSLGFGTLGPMFEDVWSVEQGSDLESNDIVTSEPRTPLYPEH